MCVHIYAATDKVKISDVQLQQAREALDIAVKKYDSGSITNLDVLNADTGRTVAEFARLQALYKYVLNTVELGRATGASH